MELGRILSCVIFLTITRTTIAVPAFTGIGQDPPLDCLSDGKISIRVTGANGYYIKTSLCSEIIQIDKAAGWYPFTQADCLVTAEEVFTASLTQSSDGTFGAEGDVWAGFMCTAKNQPVEIDATFSGASDTFIVQAQLSVADRRMCVVLVTRLEGVRLPRKIVARTQTTNTPYTAVFTPDWVVGIFQADCTTPVTTPVAVGTQLCFVIKIIDFFDEFSFQVQTIKVRRSGTNTWKTLTGGDEMPGCATGEYLLIGIWNQVEMLTPSHQRVRFPAFQMSATTGPYQLEFSVELLLCSDENFLTCGRISGCLPLPTTTEAPAIARKRRAASAEQLEFTTSVTVLGNNNTDNVIGDSDGASGGSDNNRGQTAEQFGAEECEVCMKRSVLFGLIGFFIPALILSFGASACLWFRTRKQRPKFVETEIITRSTGSSMGDSFRNPSFKR